MKRHTLILSAGLALLMASVADAQESGHLSAGYLKQATPLIHWPQGLEPRSVDVFVHNEGWIDAPPEIVWTNLIDAAQWPSWYANSADVRIEGGQSKLAKGISFNWKTFGFSIRSTVDVFEPDREIGWSGDNPSFRFTTPGCSFRSVAAHASSPRKHKRVPMRLSSGLSRRMRCTMAMIGGCLR
jgi:uncharacterized protein YndB with AHSA1/START domain